MWAPWCHLWFPQSRFMLFSFQPVTNVTMQIRGSTSSYQTEIKTHQTRRCFQFLLSSSAESVWSAASAADRCALLLLWPIKALRCSSADLCCNKWLLEFLLTFLWARSSLSALLTSTRCFLPESCCLLVFSWFLDFSVTQRWLVGNSQQIGRFWKNRHRHLHCDTQFERWQVVFIMSAWLNALTCCHDADYIFMPMCSWTGVPNKWSLLTCSQNICRFRNSL